VTEAVGNSGDPGEDVRRLRQLPAADAIRTGQLAGIGVLASNTLEEGKLFGALVSAYRPTDYERFTRQYFFNPDRPSPYGVSDFLDDRYLPVDAPGGWNATAQQLTDAIFTGIARDSMDSMQAAGNRNLYHYRFGWNQEPAPFDVVYGASHAMDLPFVFGTFDRGVFTFAFSRRNAPGRLQLSGVMDSIAAFVRTGRPDRDVLGTRREPWPRRLLLDAGDRTATAESGP
jgi:para-nitrobenzyl esterase